MFGVFGALIFIRIIHPIATKLMGKILKKIPINAQKIVSNLLIAIILVDTILSSIRYLNIF